MLPRRRLLATLAVTATAGCLSPPRADDESSGDSSAGDSSPDGDDVGRGPVRGLAESIETAASIDTDGLRYHPDNETVEYVAGSRRVGDSTESSEEPPEREPMYETVSLDRWHAIQAPFVGARAVGEAIEADLGTEVGVGVRTAIDADGAADDDEAADDDSSADADDGRAIVAYRETLLDRDGEVLAEPDVAFEPLREAAPAAATVTTRLEDTERTAEIPVYVEEQVLQQE